MNEDISGVVLAGGQSRRLGQDKTVLYLHDSLDGQNLLNRAAALLSTLVNPVRIACRQGQTRSVEGCDTIFDEGDNLGPFGGVLSALRSSGGPVFALSCDLPFMDAQCLQKLLTLRERHVRPDTLMTTFLQVETGFVEALVAIYEYAALPRFERALREGVRKLTDVIPPEFRILEPYTRRDTLPFFNINFPADLENARRMMHATLDERRAIAEALRGSA